MGHITVASIKAGNEFLFAQQTIDFLELAFPGWEWTACVERKMYYLKNLSLSDKWGMQKPVDQVDKAWLLNAGGEMLERFNMPYTFKKQALEEADRDFTGRVSSDKWTPDRRNYNKNEKRWKA